jgi:hypothetical protein
MFHIPNYLDKLGVHVFCSQVQDQTREKVYARIYHVINFEVEHLHIFISAQVLFKSEE